MSLLLRLFFSSVPLMALPAVAAVGDSSTGITSVGPAIFMFVIAGALLLTPGFFTDALGFALLTPPIRKAAFNYLRKRVHVQRFDMGPKDQVRPTGPDVIDGEYQEVDPAKPPTHGDSGWTRH